VPICDDTGRLVGIITNRDLRFMTDYNVKVSEVMTKDNLITGKVGTTLPEAQEILRQHKIEKLPLVDDEGMLRGLITIKDIEKAVQYPKSARDKNDRLVCGAAIGATEERLPPCGGHSRECGHRRGHRGPHQGRSRLRQGRHRPGFYLYHPGGGRHRRAPDYRCL
jgi:CBS-domain-containing membrane protein